ncbi:hypothetical protein N7489_008488 [Penicillium chrysogenum]|uniref:Uncharacterized protein n=1 Tax=Penicillium chrysogenum TaxID=5076 RepID=A0ABQ8X1C1_PENCH|nr:uncharacterized protein N7489_008488 [Penicillium chrysogenum]KAJ5227780.1 hypothetical protein N7489_008488 [Penicillium chrysogenum]KAJ5284584.1 hypothetical protein N7505_002564 [Penicillium chrysogenum]KAJ5286493.1 hypothetical protein N7524_001799 [Penicillium chrysogenum]
MSPESDLMEKKTTPTGSFVNTPPTPPPSEEKKLSTSAQSVLNCFKLHREGRRLESWWQHRLTPDQYTEVLRVLDGDESLRGYVEDKIRIRLPNDANNREQTYSQRCPDASFMHEDAKYPGVILEVCYSTKIRAAADLADDYILDINGSVNAVIALNIEYRGSKEATISVWRPHQVTVDGLNELEAKAVIEMMSQEILALTDDLQPFRTESGLPVDKPEQPTLQLSLRDFAPKSISQKYPDLDQDIIISSREFCEFLTFAEAEHQKQLLGKGVDEPLLPGTRKRRRVQTPPEQLSSEGEFPKNAMKRGRLTRDSSGLFTRGSES